MPISRFTITVTAFRKKYTDKSSRYQQITSACNPSHLRQLSVIVSVYLKVGGDNHTIFYPLHCRRLVARHLACKSVSGADLSFQCALGLSHEFWTSNTIS